MILVARRGPARGEDHVAFLRAPVEPRAQCGAVVGHMPEVHRRVPPAPGQRQQHGAVGVVDLPRPGFGSGGAQLVAGREHPDPEPPPHRDRADAHGGQQRQIRRREPPPGRQGHGTRRDVLARAAGVGTALHRPVESD